ncbi:MAG: nicotinate-nucleotide diphosphorylase (carboxylating) [Flavobacteriaceae bacterium]|nr:MAG: nicotinate-nucleotide diphosphorylase (carboxylating) [Flavobacteriaceae bacterium]
MKNTAEFPWYASKDKLDAFIKLALEEDLGDGDHSSMATIDKDKQNRAKLLVKDSCILAGVSLAEYIFKYYDPNLRVEVFLSDGEKAQYGDVAFEIHGSARSILTTERLVLNCMQRMSGIATFTHQMTQKLEGYNTKLLDTRKTTPNFRMLEKWAVLIGGGNNHRFGLFDMIMLKDNHIDFAGGIEKAVNDVKKYLQAKGKNLKIEVETRNLEEVKQALLAGVDRIMLDNMSPDQITEALKLIDKRTETEASGGINGNNLVDYAKTGVDYISVGGLIHSAENKDLSLKAF